MIDGNRIEMEMADAIIERPQPIEVDGVRFFLYPPTLGKTIILERHVKALGFEVEEVQAEPYKAALRACIEQREEVSRILSMHTCRNKEDLFDAELVESRTKMFCEADPEDLATILVLVMTRYSAEQFIKHLELDKERKDRERVQKCKDTKGKVYTFGGRSVYGTIVDTACERYGWTMEYVVWGISYQNLQMLMADQVQSIYLSEDEAKNCHVIQKDGVVLSADNPENIAEIARIINI